MFANLPRHPRTRRALRLVGVTLLALLAPVACRAGPPPGDPTPPPVPATLPEEAYAELVAAFFGGVDALDAGDNQGAFQRLQRSTELAPEEPAGWANLALASLRLNDPAAAEAAVARARELAPTDGDIALLAALVKSRQGGGEAALAALRQAVEVAPEHLRARFALYQELSRATDTASQEEAAAALATVLAAVPDNQVARVEQARSAARAGNTDRVQEALAALAPASEGWAEQARNALAAAGAATEGSDARALGQKLAILGNVLLAEPGYQADMAALQSPSTEVGQPVRTFLRLPAPQAEAYPADSALRFESQPSAQMDQGAWAVPVNEDGPPVLAYMRDGQLTLETEPPVTLEAPAAPPVHTQPPAAAELPRAGVASIDWNNDRLPDLALAGEGGLRLHQRAADGSWLDVTGAAGLPSEVLAGSYLGVWPVDIDLEGDLDLVLGVREGRPPVLQNNGDGTWTVTQPLDLPSGPTDLAWADFDGDGDPDVATVGFGRPGSVALEGSALTVLWNERSSQYRAVPGDSEYVAVTVADADGDGRLDLVAWRAEGDIVRVAPAEDGSWQAAPLVTSDLLTHETEARLLWADLDLNGAGDLVASGSSTSRIWLGGPDGTLGPLPESKPGGVNALADLDGDGRLDVVGLAGTVWRNAAGDQAYHWQVIRPKTVTQGDQRVNSFGVGGQVTLRSGLLRQTVPIAGPAVHLGLGAAAKADVLRIQWPNGVPQTEFDLAADQAVVAEQRLKGSCPWLFADDGTGQKFVTDVLWKSPLGLRINAQDTAGVAQTRDWVKVRADQLVPKDGQYALAITAELWETHYFDHVALLAVDHPADTEVFVDERFVIPPPPLAVVVTGPLAPVAGAVDHRGRDVAATVRARDDTYLDGFELARYQGLAENHYVELDLGAAVDGLRTTARAAGREDPQFVLIGQGWLYPTDSSINVALGQGSHPPPSALRIEVQDANGKWGTARENQGFPAGKHKTSLFELRGLAPDGAAAPERLRLGTNLEIYWDLLAVAELRPDITPAIATLPADLAELRYRGFSGTNYTASTAAAATNSSRAPVHRPHPEIPDYDHLMSAAPLWLDLVGYYTRFGDIRPLLETVDDRYAILNAGDEIRLRFPALPTPAAGTSRDFVFVSDGWEKDGDFNTAYSETVLPLPSHDRPGYADPVESGPVGVLQEDPVYQRYPADWLDYHTRYVGPPGWHRR